MNKARTPHGIEVATHGIAQLSVQGVQVVRLGENVRPHGTGQVATFGCVFDHEMDVGHGLILFDVRADPSESSGWKRECKAATCRSIAAVPAGSQIAFKEH